MKTKKKALLGVIILSIIVLFGVFGVFRTTADAATTTEIKVAVKYPALDTIKLKWNAVDGAAGYNVYVSTDDGQKYQLAASVNNTAMVFDQLTRDKNYRFKVMAYQLKSGLKMEFLSSREVIANANRIGIDVSHWQGNIDWAKVKASGVQFAMIKATESFYKDGKYQYYNDPKLEDNLSNAIANKVPVGVYHYAQATTVEEAKQDANYILSRIKGYKITYPVVIDIEKTEIYKDLSKETNTAIINAFCEVIKAAGYTPMVYSGCNFSKNYFDRNAINYDFWIAHYSTNGTIVNNHYHFNSDSKHYEYTRMWQFSSSLPVEGINDPTVDHNYEFDIKESVVGFTHYDMNTKTLSYRANSRDTITTIADKNAISESTLLAVNKGVTTSTPLAGQSLTISTEPLGKPIFKIGKYQLTSVRLLWSPVQGAYQYNIQRSTSKDGTYTTIKKVNSMTKVYVDTTASFGVNYYYRIIAIGLDGTTVKSVSSDKVAFKLVVPAVTNVKASSVNYNTVKLAWSKVDGADGYTIKYATSKNGSYKTLATVTTNTYTSTKLSTGRTYYFKVYTMYKDSKGKYYSSPVITSAKPILNKVTSFKVSATTYNSVTMSWKKTSGAGYYYVYRSAKADRGYKRIGTTTKTTYKDKTVKTGTTYYYKVVAARKVSGKYYTSAYTSYVKIKPSITKTAVTKITAGAGKISLTYQKVSGASGYEIYRATTQNGTYKKIATTKSTTYTNKGLGRNKGYYYKVRAYRIVNGKTVFGSYSSIVGKKTK